MKKLITISLVALYLVALLPLSAANAQTTPSLSYLPGSGSIELNAAGNFTVSVIVNTGGLNSSGADVYTRYNTSELDFVGGTWGNFYPREATGWPTSDSGNINMGATILAPADPNEDPVYVSGSGTFATLTFTPATTLAPGATMPTTLRFDFTLGSTTDSNIAGEDYETSPDILVSAPSATYTLVGYAPADDPVINSFIPTSGLANIDVPMTISGDNFNSTQGSVYIGTRSAVVTSWSNTSIVIIVPQVSITSNSGPHQVKITRTDGKDATASGYTYLAPGSPPSTDPNITSIVPSSGEEGTDVVVDVYGQNFGSAQGSLSMGSLSSSIISWTDSRVVIRAYGSSVNISQDTLYPITLTRTDGRSDTYTGFMVRVGIGFVPVFGGLLLFNGTAAYLVKRKWFS